MSFHIIICQVVFTLIQINECTFNDARLLAEMNKLLIEDESAENAMSLSQLEDRMTDFLSSHYKAFFLLSKNVAIGYALCDMSKKPVYLRQFFINRTERRKGYGKQAFHSLLSFLGTDEIDIDVYVWNKAGVSFWESLGFEKRCFNMRYRKDDTH